MKPTPAPIADVEYSGTLSDPVAVLEQYVVASGRSLIQAAFAHSFFLDPAAVGERSPYFPDRARYSRTHYPNQKKGDVAEWEGREVRLDDNSRAQMAWAKYSKTPLARRSGYGVRHVWGHPWDPDAFTAGWNLCYMPFWVGMLTEDQHPHPELARAIQQASYDLYFRAVLVCDRPKFVSDPGLDLRALLKGRPIRILRGGGSPPGKPQEGGPPRGETAEEIVKRIRAARHCSWTNVLKAVRELRGLSHEPFGTKNVQNTSRSVANKMAQDAQLSLAALEDLIGRFAGLDP